MKRFAKLICLLLAVSLIAAMFVSCKKDKGEIIAVYNDTPVYEADVEELLSYKMATELAGGATESELQTLLEEAVTTYVQFLMLELDLKEQGIKVDESYVNKEFEAAKEELDKSFEGGYSAWTEAYGVSEDFLKEELRRYILAEMYYDLAEEKLEIAEDEIKAYYNANASKYFRGKGYNWSVLFREVKDITDETECQTAKNEAQEYIYRINEGKMTWDEVETQLLERFTEEDGYGKAAYFNGENFTYNTSVIKIDDLDAYLAGLDETYKERDENAAEDSEAYELYMEYIGKCFEAETYYALQNLNAGEIYEKPIKNFVGYAIIRLDSYTEESYFIPLDDVREEITEELMSTKIEESFVAYLEELETKYSVSYLFEIQLG